MKLISILLQLQSLLFSGLPSRYKYKLLACIGLIIVSSASEVASVALLGRYASYIVNSKSALPRQPMQSVLDRIVSSLINPTHGSLQVLIIVVLAFALALLLRNFNALYISLTCADVTAFANTAILSKNITSATISPSRKSTSSILTDLTSYASIFQEQIMQPLLLATSALILVISFLALMFSYSPLISALLIIPPFISYISASLFLRRKLIFNSQAFEYHSAKSLSLAADAIGGYKDIILNDLSASRLAEYKREDKAARYANGKLFVYATNPRFFAETSAYLSIIAIPFVSYLLNKDLNISAFATCLLSMQKLLPSSQQIYFNISRLLSVDVYISRLIDAIYTQHNELKRAESIDSNQTEHDINLPISTSLSFRGLIFEQVSFFYKTDGSEVSASESRVSSRNVLSNISFRLNRGDTLFLGGPSGSGKTTMMNLMIGLLNPTEGRVLINAFDEHSMSDISTSDVSSYAPKLFSYCQQNPHIYNETIIYNITLSKSLSEHSWSHYSKCLRVCMLNELINSLPQVHSTRIGQAGYKLSGGQYQRIALARALYAKKDVIFLDECTSALDACAANLIISSMLKEFSESTFVMISHDRSLSDLFARQLDL